MADVDIVIAAKVDRLFRLALDALKVVESLKTRGVKLHLLDLGGDIAVPPRPSPSGLLSQGNWVKDFRQRLG